MSASPEETQTIDSAAKSCAQSRHSDESRNPAGEVVAIQSEPPSFIPSDTALDINAEGNAQPAAVDARIHGENLAYRAWDFWVRKSWMLWILAAVVILLDQSTKSIIVGWLSWGESWPAEGFLRLTHARNTGTAFSLFQGHSNILSIVAIVAVGVLLWVYWSTGAKSFILRVALGLQLGGAIGNLLDRLQQGYVTDFIDVGPWPIFNVADSAISVGMVLMLWYFFTIRDEPKPAATVATSESSPVDMASGCQMSDDAMQVGTPREADSDAPESEIRS